MAAGRVGRVRSEQAALRPEVIIRLGSPWVCFAAVVVSASAYRLVSLPLWSIPILVVGIWLAGRWALARVAA